jgi:8-oxo-dGTP pyrophosphatase MutT (NUDIX family)
MSSEPDHEQPADPKRAKNSKRRARRGSDHETSAGGVVIRGEAGKEQLITIVPVRRSPSGSRVLCLPKGHIDPGEDALQAAVREVREETGVSVELIADLGEIGYWYRRENKTVSKSVDFFLFRYVSGDLADHDDEVERARWIDLRKALSELSYDGEREILARALQTLGAPVGADGSDDVARRPRRRDR